MPNTPTESDDILVGTPGEDFIYGLGGDDSIRGGGGNDTLQGGIGNDFIDGGDGDDHLQGEEDNDYLRGGPGDDLIDGGLGIDRVAYAYAPSAVTVDLRIQNLSAQNTGGAGLDTIINVENVSGSYFSDTLYGNDNANWIWALGPTNGITPTNDNLYGNGGNDLLQAGTGNHILDGGSGIDTISFGQPGDILFAIPDANGNNGIVINLLIQGVAQNTHQGMMTLISIENVSGSVIDDVLRGSNTANVIAGDAGNDFLYGNGGNDTIYGDGAIGVDTGGTALSGPINTFTADQGTNVDFYDAAGQLVFLFEGQDLYDSAGNPLPAPYVSGDPEDPYTDYYVNGVHYIFYIGGSTASDGVAGNDLLDGGDGDDMLFGGGGNDLLRGGVGPTSGNDLLDGGDGDDYLTGGAGNDTIIGGGGIDRAGYFTNVGGVGVIVDLRIASVAQDTGSQGMDIISGVENLSGTTFADTLTGDDLDNWLWGSTANYNGTVSSTNDDTISGNGGNDLIVVGIGNHLLDGGADNDTIAFTENGGLAVENGIDLSLALQGSAQDTGYGSWNLSNFENLSGGQGNDHLTGDGGANRLTGEGGDDTLEGGGGNDILSGDAVYDADTHDTGYSGAARLMFDPDAAPGDDHLDGGAGDDIALFLLAPGGGILTLVDSGAMRLVQRGGVTVAEITISGGTVTVHGVGAGAHLGTDNLAHIEHLDFSIFGSAAHLIVNPGVVVDGYVAGGLVFADANGNGALDPGEASATTDSAGNFTLVGGSGPLIMTGGTNVDTGLPNLVTLTAPEGSTVVNPLTTLVQAIVVLGGGAISVAQAQDKVASAFGIDTNIDLTSFDPLAATPGDADALAVQQASAAVVVLTLAGADAAGGGDAYEDAVLRALASTINAAGGEVDLSDTGTVAGILIIALPGGTQVNAAAQDVADAANAINGAIDLAGVADAQQEALNDAPENHLPATQTGYEDNVLVFSAVNGNAITVTDADAAGGTLTVTLDIASGSLNPASGSGASFPGGTGSNHLVISGTLAQIEAALDGLEYQPVANASGSLTLTIITDDGGNIGAGGALQDVNTLTIDIIPANDAPEGADKAATIDEDASYTFTLADFPITDLEGNGLYAVQIVTLPAAGTLLNDGTPVEAGWSILAADIAASKFTFVPAADGNGPGYGSFSFKVVDDGASAFGGTDIAANANIFTIDVTAVQDTPTAPPTSNITLDENVPSSPFAIGAADPDADTLAYSIDANAMPAHGSVTFDQPNGTFTYTPTPDTNGADAFVILIDDGHGHVIQQLVSVDIQVPDIVVDLNGVATPGHDYSTSFTEGGAGAPIGTNLALSSVHPIVLAVVEIDPGSTGDSLNFAGSPPGALHVTGQGTSQIQITGTGSAADYQAVIAAITISNSTQDPTFNGTVPSRDVIVTIGDGFTQRSAHTHVDMVAVNDVATISGTDTGFVFEDFVFAASGNLLIADVDPNEDRFQVSNQTGLYGSFQFTALGHWQYASSSNQSLRGGQVVTDTFTVLSQDGQTSHDVVISVNGNNDFPNFFVIDDSGTVTEDAPGQATDDGQISISDVDQGESGFQVSHVVTAYGTFDMSASGAWTYQINNASHAVQFLGAGDTHVETFQVSSIDGTYTPNIHVQVQGAFDAGPNNIVPIAPANNNVTIAEDTLSLAVTIGASDGDNDTLTYSVDPGGMPSLGSVTFNQANGTFVFTPYANANGSDAFNILIEDGFGGTAQQVVAVTISAVNDAPAAIVPASFAATEQQALDLKHSLSVSDVDAGGSSVTATLSVGYGVLNLVAGTSGAVVSNNNSAAVTITGTIAQINALLDSNATSVVSYLANTDNPPSSTTISLSVNDGGHSGTGDPLIGSASGSITITGSNDAPLAVADTNAGDPVVEAGVSPGNATFAGDGSASGNVLANDTDPDAGDTISVSAVTGDSDKVGVAVAGTYGSVTINANGSYTYALNNADPETDALPVGASATDVFNYTTTDAQGATSSATLTISIAGTNDAPTVGNVTLPGGQDVVNAGFEQSPDFAGWTIDPFVSNPTADSHSEIYRSGGIIPGDFAIARLELSGTRQPAISYGPSITSSPFQAVAGDIVQLVYKLEPTFGRTGLLGQIIQNGTNVVVASFEYLGTDFGTGVMVDDMSIPSTGSFRIVVSASSSSGVINREVGEIASIGFAGLINTHNEDQAFAFSNGKSLLLANAGDVDAGDVPDVAPFTTTSSMGATVTLAANGSLTIDPTGAPGLQALAVGTIATDSFTFTVSDGHGGLTTATASFIINGVNDAPTANDDNGLLVNEDVPTTFSTLLLANDSDLDGDTLTITAVSNAVHGVVSLNGGVVTFTPDANYNASSGARFDYMISDGHGGTDTATAFLTVAPINDAPTVSIAAPGDATEQVPLDLKTFITLVDPDADSGVLTPIFVTLHVDHGIIHVDPGTIVLDTGLSGIDPIVGNDSDTVTITGHLAQIQALLAAGGTSVVTYTDSDDAPAATATLTVTIDDNGQSGTGQRTSATDTETFNIIAVDDPATAVNDTGIATLENATVNIAVLANDSDPDGTTPAVAMIDGHAIVVGGTVTLTSGATVKREANGTLTYDPNGRFNFLTSTSSGQTGAVNTSAPDSFTYTLAGAGGGTATVSVTVGGVATVQDHLEGDTSNNIVIGTPNGDFFDLSQGGDDQATGLGGNDGFFFGAAFTADDQVNGGGGTNDQIGLQGNYAGGNALLLGPNTIANVEAIVVLPGFSYDITTNDGNVAPGGMLKIQATQLAPGQSLTFDGSAEHDGSFIVYGGQGNDNMTGGSGNDGFYFGPNGFSAGDVVNGGPGGNDQLALDGSYGNFGTPFVLGGNVTNVEVLVLLPGPSGSPNSFNLTTSESFVAGGATMTVFGLLVGTDIIFDGSHEHDGAFRFYGGAGNDVFTGSSGNDWMFGGGGGDALIGGSGSDTFFYDDASQSTSLGFDRITGFDDNVDTIDLPFAVAGFATPVTGNLSSASFDTDLGTAFAGLSSHQAGMFTATGGDMSGRTFLVVDADGTAGYQAGSDYVIEFIAPTTPIDNPALFI